MPQEMRNGPESSISSSLPKELQSACDHLLQRMSVASTRESHVSSVLSEMAMRGISLPHQDFNLHKVSSLNDLSLPTAITQSVNLLVLQPSSGELGRMSFSELANFLKSSWNQGENDLLAVSSTGEAALLVNQDGGVSFCDTTGTEMSEDVFRDMTIPRVPNEYSA